MGELDEGPQAVTHAAAPDAGSSPEGGEDEVTLLLRLRDEGVLPPKRLHLLAYLDYEPAIAALGEEGSAPDSQDMPRWAHGLRRWGSDPCARAVLALLPHVPQAEVPGWTHSPEFLAWVHETTSAALRWLDTRDEPSRLAFAALLERYLAEFAQDLPKSTRKKGRKKGAKAPEGASWREVKDAADPQTPAHDPQRLLQHRIAFTLRSLLQGDVRKEIHKLVRSVPVSGDRARIMRSALTEWVLSGLPRSP